MIETNRRFERIEFTRRGIINSARRKSRLGRGEAHNSSIAGATSFARPLVRTWPSLDLDYLRTHTRATLKLIPGP